MRTTPYPAMMYTMRVYCVDHDISPIYARDQVYSFFASTSLNKKYGLSFLEETRME